MCYNSLIEYIEPVIVQQVIIQKVDLQKYPFIYKGRNFTQQNSRRLGSK